MNSMPLDELERRHKETKSLTETTWNPTFEKIREVMNREGIELVVSKIGGPWKRTAEYGGEIHKYKVRIGFYEFYVDLLPWLGFDQIRSCIICRHDESNPSSDSGHAIDEDDYCVACRRMSARILENLAKKMAERDSKTVLEEKS